MSKRNNFISDAFLAIILLILPLQAAGGEIIGNNSLKLLPTGNEFYTELLSAIDGAHSYICTEYYGVGKDSISTLFLDHLLAKAKQGVKVYAMIDGWGSFHRDNPMDESWLEEYRLKGLDIAIFNKYDISKPVPRDHRKLTVIDGSTAFFGGMNINDANLIGTPEGVKVIDMSVRIDGPAAGALAAIFAKVWNEYSMRPSIDLARSPSSGGSTSVELLPTVGGPSENPTVTQNYIRLINSAQRSIRLVNGYFMPSAPILNALRKAAERGVIIDIVLGEETDLPSLLKNRPFNLATELAAEENISLHMVPGTFFHEKAMSIDGESVMIGSTNLDMLSRKINYELSVLIFSTVITTQYNAIFDSYYGKSSAIM